MDELLEEEFVGEAAPSTVSGVDREQQQHFVAAEAALSQEASDDVRCMDASPSQADEPHDQDLEKLFCELLPEWAEADLRSPSPGMEAAASALEESSPVAARPKKQARGRPPGTFGSAALRAEHARRAQEAAALEPRAQNAEPTAGSAAYARAALQRKREAQWEEQRQLQEKSAPTAGSTVLRLALVGIAGKC